MENEALDLGTHFWLHFDALADNQESYTVAQLVTALETTTTLRTLAVSSYSSVTVNVNSPRIVEPLCRCLADLRLQNEHHPLKAIHFHYLDSDIVRQFFVALKQFGIPRVLLRSRTFPIRFLIDFCRDNSNLKVLNLKNITFADEDAADRIGYSAAITLNLDKLILNKLCIISKDSMIAAGCETESNIVTFLQLAGSDRLRRVVNIVLCCQDPHHKL